MTYTKSHVLVIFILCISGLSFSQKKQKIEIVNANLLEVMSSKGRGAKRLIGDVAFKQEDVMMYCDSAYFYSKENRLKAYNNVHIVQEDSLDLYGDSLDYNGNMKFAKLRGNIKLSNSKIDLETNYLDYDIKNKFGYYVGNGTVYNKKDKSVLTSDLGYFYPQSNSFFFKDNVQLKHPDYTITSDTMKYNSQTDITFFLGPTTILKDSNHIYCETGMFNPNTNISHFVGNAFVESEDQKIVADSIYYDQNQGYVELFEHVEIIDTTDQVTISGDYSFYHEKDSFSIVYGNTLLMQVFDDDTLFLHADTLYSFYDSTGNYQNISAYRKARFYKSDMQGKCDSLLFSEQDSTIQLFYDPVLWADENQMTADSISIKQYDGEIKSFTLLKNSFIASEEDTTKYNQIKGKDMIGHFLDNELYKINVINNGQTIYYAEDEEDESYIGVNKAVCTNMNIYLDSNKVHKITFLTQPTATLYPLDKVSSNDLILPGFVWKAYLRPMKMEDIFDWVEEKTTSPKR